MLERGTWSGCSCRFSSCASCGCDGCCNEGCGFCFCDCCFALDSNSAKIFCPTESDVEETLFDWSTESTRDASLEPEESLLVEAGLEDGVDDDAADDEADAFNDDDDDDDGSFDECFLEAGTDIHAEDEDAGLVVSFVVSFLAHELDDVCALGSLTSGAASDVEEAV